MMKNPKILKKLGEMVTQFNYDKITGLVSRNYPIFNDETKKIISDFYLNLFKGDCQGIALLKARQQCMAEKVSKLIEQQTMDVDSENITKRIDIKSSLAISSYILFGKPWKKLNP